MVITGDSPPHVSGNWESRLVLLFADSYSSSSECGGGLISVAPLNICSKQ